MGQGYGRGQGVSETEARAQVTENNLLAPPTCDSIGTADKALTLWCFSVVALY